MSDDDIKTDAPAPVVAAASAAKAPSIFDMFETDESVETMGVLLRYGPTIRVLVARAGGSNKAFEKVVKNLTKPYRQLLKAVQAGSASDDDAKVLEDLMQQAYAQTVVRGWEGIQLKKDGPMVECTPENVLTIFKTIPQLWIDIRDFASNYLNYLANVEDTAEVAKN